MFKKIIVGFDGSETSKNAVRIACDLAGKYGSDLHLVHTPQPETVAFALGAVAGYHAVTTMPSKEEVKDAADKVVKAGEAIAAEQNCPIKEVHVMNGTPAENIVDCAEDLGADLIVTGRRGLGKVGALVQGSTTQRIGHLAKCACLSVV